MGVNIICLIRGHVYSHLDSPEIDYLRGAKKGHMPTMKCMRCKSINTHGSFCSYTISWQDDRIGERI